MAKKNDPKLPLGLTVGSPVSPGKKSKRKKPSVTARPVGRPAPLVALHERYGLAFEPGQDADPIVKDELDALRELYKQRTNREIGDEADTRSALESAGLIRGRVSRKKAEDLGKREDGLFASALDALDSLSESKWVQRPITSAWRSEAVQEPFSSAARLIGGERAGEAVESGFEAADKALGKAVGPAVTGAATVLAPYTLLGTTETGRRIAAPVIEKAVAPIGEMIGEARTTPGGRAIERLGREAVPAVRRGLGALAEGVSEIPSPIPDPTGLRVQATSTGRLGSPAGKPRTLGDVQATFEEMASSPEKFIPFDIATTDTTAFEGASDATRDAIRMVSEGLPVPDVQSALEQNQQGPFSVNEDLFYRARAEENGFDVAGWGELTPGEKLYQAYTKNTFLGQTFRSAVRAVGETGSVVAGVKAIVEALASAPSDDAEELKMVLRGMIAPYAYAKSVAERDGLAAGLEVAFRDQPVDFVIAANAALRAGGRIGGVVARTGRLGARAKEFAQAGRVVTAERKGTGVRALRREPIETQQPSWMGFVEAAPEIEARRVATEKGRVDEATGRPFALTVTQEAPPVLVGFTTPNLTSGAGLALKSFIAKHSSTYADRLESKAAKTYTRREANVADGVAVEIQQALTSALGRAPKAIELERAAFELTWAKQRLNVRVVDGKLVFGDGAPVTPGLIASYFRGLAGDLEKKIDPEFPDPGDVAQIDRWRAQAIEWDRIDAVELKPEVIKELRKVARPLGEKNDQLIAAALGVPLNEAKRANYIRLLVIDPEFEKAARELKASVNPRTRAAYVELWKAQRAVERLSRRLEARATAAGWGKKSAPKSRATFKRVTRELVRELRRAERAAARLGDDALVAQYRAARAEIVAARVQSRADAEAMVDLLGRMRRGEARVEEVPEYARAAYEPLREATGRVREAEVAAAEALGEVRTTRGEPARRVPTERDIALAEQKVQDGVEGAAERVEAMRAAQAANQTLVSLRSERLLTEREFNRVLKEGRPVLDNDQLTAVVDAASGVAAIKLKRAKEYRVLTLDQARGEVIDEFIARVESLDQNALLHLVQQGPIEKIDAPNIVETMRTINVGPAGRIRPGRLKPSKGSLFALGGEATNRMWKNLMFDTAELIAAEGWRKKMRQMIELTGVKVTISSAAQRRAAARVKERIAAGEFDEARIIEEEIRRELNADSVQFSLGDFKVINPLNPQARTPSETVFRGMVDQNIDPASAAGLMWRELNDRTIDPKAPGDYILLPRAVYDGIQTSLKNEAFRFKPRSKGVRKALSGYGLDRATAAWRTMTLNILPKTAFANLTGSAILALQGGAGPRSFYYAWRALRGSTDANGKHIPIPPELLQRYYANLTVEVGRGGKMAQYPIGVQWAAAWAAKWMNTMRMLNGISEDFGRLAVYYSKAVPEAKRAAAREAGGGRVDEFMARAKGLNDRALELLEDMAEDAPEWRAKNAQFIQQSYDFLGDLHRGGRAASVARIMIPFWQWYVHMLKLTFFTMPVKYPGRALMLQQLGGIGDEYQRTHGVMIPWGEDLVPLFTESQDIGGLPQWVTTAIGTSNFYPQATVSGLGGREGEPSVMPFIRGGINPAIVNTTTLLASLGAIAGGGSAYEPDDYRILRAAKDEYGNEITSVRSDEFANFVFNRLGQIVPLSPTIMSMGGRASTSTLWSPKEKPKKDAQIDRRRQDIWSVIHDPWGPNVLAFLAKAFTGVTLTDVPGLGPVERKRLRDTADALAREERIRERNIAKNILTALNEEPVSPTPNKFGAE